MELLVLEEFAVGFVAAFFALFCGIGVFALFLMGWVAEEDAAGRRPLYPEWPEDAKVAPVRRVEFRIAA